MEKLPLILDFSNKKKLCDQVVIGIRSLILSNKLEPGERLPTVRVLAAQLRINFNTVARAYRILETERWITTRQGRGTFVISKTDAEKVDQQQIEEDAVNQVIELLRNESLKLSIPVSTILKRVNERLFVRSSASSRKRVKRNVLLTKGYINPKQVKEAVGYKNLRRIHIKRKLVKRLKV